MIHRPPVEQPVIPMTGATIAGESGPRLAMRGRDVACGVGPPGFQSRKPMPDRHAPLHFVQKPYSPFGDD